MDQKQLEAHLWKAANILRGMIDAADFKQYIFPLLFFKRLSDVWDEETKTAGPDLASFRENHRFQIPEGCHWQDIREATTDIGEKLQSALQKIERDNEKTLQYIFGDAQWTNKRRLSDRNLSALIEHFSSLDLSVANVPHDVMGNAYEYLVGTFADDSGHTAAEFYTNRSVVKLMTRITAPSPGESVYDPTCGSGGILLGAVLHLKEIKNIGEKYRTLKLYGQELNLITSAIARMNMFMHDFDDSHIAQGDTLSDPQFLQDDRLKKFDVVMANPPYSVKRWDQQKFISDPFGRNIWGAPPPGNADYAFQQHIIASLNPKTGRSVSLWPHGVLFRDAEAAMRKKMIAEDRVEAVIGLGKDLFYNSSMESCLLVCRMKKPATRRGKIIFINGVDEVKLGRNDATLLPEHINKMADAYWKFKDIANFAKVMSTADVLKNDGNLSLKLYVSSKIAVAQYTTAELLAAIKQQQSQINQTSKKLFANLRKLGISG